MKPYFHEVQCRGGKWFAIFPSISRELAPVFDNPVTADEVGRKFILDERFFDKIPTVPMGYPYPRPDPC